MQSCCFVNYPNYPKDFSHNVRLWWIGCQLLWHLLSKWNLTHRPKSEQLTWSLIEWLNEFIMDFLITGTQDIKQCHFGALLHCVFFLNLTIILQNLILLFFQKSHCKIDLSLLHNRTLVFCYQLLIISISKQSLDTIVIGLSYERPYLVLDPNLIMICILLSCV